MSVQLQIKDVSSGYDGKTVLNDVSFSVRKGEVLAVIGQNGCGKSTLLKTIARIISDNSGDVIFRDVKINGNETWDLKRLGITYFVQGGMVFSTMTVGEHFELAFEGCTTAVAERIRQQCFSYFPALRGLGNSLGGNLSGGERQMLSFAMLIAQQTDCWLLDEPTAGLAPEPVKEAVAFLQRLKQESEKTMILVEHNYQVAFELADRVAVIKDGELKSIFPRSEFQSEDFLDKHLFD